MVDLTRDVQTSEAPGRKRKQDVNVEDPWSTENRPASLAKQESTFSGGGGGRGLMMMRKITRRMKEKVMLMVGR